MKRAIIVKGRADVGKSTIINQLYDWIVNSYPHTFLESKVTWPNKTLTDFRAVLKIGNLVIGICSAGDDLNTVNTHLDKCFQHDCDIIIGACRTRMSTYNAITSRLQYPTYITDWCIPEGIAPSSNMAQRVAIGVEELKARLIALPKL